MQARVLWSLLWRSVLLLPMGAFVCLAVMGFPVLMLALVAGAGVFMLNGHWLWGVATLAAVFPLISTRRWLVGRVIDNHTPSGLP